MENISCEILIQEINIGLLNNAGEGKEAIKGWIDQNWSIIVQDMEKIFKNRNLVIESILRIIDNTSILNGKGDSAEKNNKKKSK